MIKYRSLRNSYKSAKFLSIQYLKYVFEATLFLGKFDIEKGGKPFACVIGGCCLIMEASEKVVFLIFSMMA